MSLEIWSFVVDVLSLIATVVLTVAIYWLQRSHEKEREQMEVEAQKKAVAEAARVFLIDNEDEIEYLPLSAIAKSLNLKRKHHRAITTKFLRCSEEVQKEILKQANFQPIEVSKEQVSAALKRLKDDIKACGFGQDTLYDGAKYFHRAMERYSDEKIETVNPYIFEDICLGYDEAAKICLTHSFNNHTINEYIGKFDVSDEEMKMIKTELARTVYDDYDRLIQLCDSLAGAEGVLDIEDRMNDVKKRYGFYPQDKWDSNMRLKQYFEKKMKKDIYLVCEKDSFVPEEIG